MLIEEFKNCLPDSVAMYSIFMNRGLLSYLPYIAAVLSDECVLAHKISLQDKLQENAPMGEKKQTKKKGHLLPECYALRKGKTPELRFRA